MRVARLQLSVNKRKRELCVSIILFDVFFVPCDSAGISVIRLGFEPKTPTLKVLCSTD